MRFYLAGFLLLTGCASTGPYAPVSDVRYSALGEDPFWMVAIGDDRIVLTLGGERGRLLRNDYPRVLPRREGESRIWESGSGTEVITVESRPGPCTGSRGRRFEDEVRVRLSGRELQGCGGPVLSGGRG